MTGRKDGTKPLKKREMKFKVYLPIAIHIILLIGAGMLMTFVTPELREFFGDTTHVCQGKWCHHGMVDDGYDWGARHYWYQTGMVLLFLLSLASSIIHIIRVITKNYTIKLSP